MTTDVPERMLVDAKRAAGMLGVSRAHFYRMHKRGLLPLPVRLGGSVRWRTDELRVWVAAGMPSRAKWAAMNPRLNGGVQ
jgi:predicted DNA-binding transcriptional regulator AlpA